MKLDQIKNFGKELSRSELKMTSGGNRPEISPNIAHGMCVDGTRFSYTYVPGNDTNTTTWINQHYCGGNGIAYIEDRGWLEP